MMVKMIAPLTALMLLSACATAPHRIAAPPPPANEGYRWTLGAAPRAAMAMQARFGRQALPPGGFVWADTIPAGTTAIIVDLKTQTTFIYRGDVLVGASNISSGKPGKDTPLGHWTILQKKPKHFSRKYDNAPMPWMQRIDDYGIAFHAGVTPGYPASRGCIRLPAPFAERLYRLTMIGTKVTIEG